MLGNQVFSVVRWRTLVLFLIISFGLFPPTIEAKIFDGQRQGFIAGFYGGVAPSAAFESEGARTDMSYTGAVFGVVVGHGVSNRGAVYFDVAAVSGEFEDRPYREFSICSFGLAGEYYFTNNQKPWFVNGGMGWGILVIDHEDGIRFGTSTKGSIGKFVLKHVWVGCAISHAWGSGITATSGQVLVGVMGF